MGFHLAKTLTSCLGILNPFLGGIVPFSRLIGDAPLLLLPEKEEEEDADRDRGGACISKQLLLLLLLPLHLDEEDRPPVVR